MRLHETMFGKRFFEGQIPEFIRSLNAIQLSLVKIHQNNEKFASLKGAELEMKHKELVLKQRELALKERELLLKEKE